MIKAIRHILPLSLLVGAFAAGCASEAGTEPENVDDVGQAMYHGILVTNNVAPYDSVFHYQVNSAICTATRISATRFLTAAHCVEGAIAKGDPIKLSNALNGLTLSDTIETTIEKIARHPFWEKRLAYGEGRPDNFTVPDLAVFDVPPGEVPATIPALSVPDAFVTDGVTGVGVGYGLDAFNTTHNNKKQRESFKSISTSDYRIMRNGSISDELVSGEWTRNIITDDRVTGDSTALAGTSNGDSGGPWAKLNATTGKWEVMGVVSGSTSYASVFSRTQLGARWIANPVSNQFANSSRGYFMNSRSEKCMSAAGSAADGDMWQLWCQGNLPTSRWELTDRGGGYFTIKNLGNGLCLAVDGASTVAGARVSQYACSTAASFLWKFTPRTAVDYAIINKNSGKCIGNNGASTTFTRVNQYGCVASDKSQRWVFAP